MGKSSSSKSSTSANQQDQRIVAGEGAFVAGPGSAVDQSVSASNSGNTTIYSTGTDAGAVKLAETNTEFLKAAAASQGDAAKFIAQAGAGMVADMGEALTDLYATAGSNNTRAWQSTLDTAGGLIDRMLGAAEQTSAGAREVAQAAIASYQPTENKMGDAFKYAAIAAAVVVAFKVIK